MSDVRPSKTESSTSALRGPSLPPVFAVDTWGAGLRFGVKALNTRTVARAKTPADVLPVCLAHNLRQDNQTHRHRSRIDPVRAHLNEVVAGPDNLDLAVSLVGNSLEAMGIEPRRKDAIMGVELVFQPPPESDHAVFWAECLKWAHSRFEHVVSAVVHHDQKRPHMHLLVLAVCAGRLAGNEMTAVPNRPKQRRADFMAHMRSALGLRPDRKVKTLAELAVSSGKGPKTQAQAARRDAELMRNAQISSKTDDVGKGVHGLGGWIPAPSNPHSPQPPVIAQLSRADKVHLLWALMLDLNCTAQTPIRPAPRPGQTQGIEQVHAQELVRVREDEMPVETWDTDSGEFRTRPAPQMPTKTAAQAWVRTALQGIGAKPGHGTQQSVQHGLCVYGPGVD